SLTNRYSMRPFALTSVLMMLACSEATGPDGRFTTNLGPGEFAIATADTDVTLHFVGGVLSGNIPFEFTNVSNQTIYLPNCNGGYELALERPYRGGWMYAWSGFLPGCISPAIRLAPGETRQDTMGIYAYTSMIVRPPSA